MTGSITLVLPERVDLVGDPAIAAFLHAHRNRPVEVSARALRRIDSLLLQFLIVAAADWRARGLPFRLTGLSPSQADLLALLGIGPGILDHAGGGTA